MSIVLETRNLCFSYDGKGSVLKDVSFTFETGKIYAIIGKSGAGKTTLLSLLAGLAAPSSGQILLDGEDMTKLNPYEIRSSRLGVVFQSYNLLTQLTALENVELSMDISGKKFRGKRERAEELLQKVELEEEEIGRRILKLSGGQQQRVAIARALSCDPEILLADEPTGNLDEETQSEIMRIFRKLADEGKCVIIVTHSPSVAASADVRYELTKSPAQKRR